MAASLVAGAEGVGLSFAVTGSQVAGVPRAVPDLAAAPESLSVGPSYLWRFSVAVAIQTRL